MLPVPRLCNLRVFPIASICIRTDQVIASPYNVGMTTEPTPTTKYRLFALSGNRCAFPDCTHALVDEATHTPIYAIAHIKSENPGGSRYDPDQTDNERRGFDNLILLCPNHHALIDKKPELFPAEALYAMKRRHEGAFAAWQPSPEMIGAFEASISVQTVTDGSIITTHGQSGGIAAHHVNQITIQQSTQKSFEEAAVAFRDERIARIDRGDTPVPVTPLAKLVLHLFPAASIGTQAALDMDSLSSKSNYVRPLYCGYGETRLNRDGVLSYASDNASGLYSTYLQVFRSGAIEAVDTMILRPRDGDETTADIQMNMDGVPRVEVPGFIPRRRVEEELIYGVHRYLALLNELAIPCPVRIAIALLGVKGYQLSGSYPLMRRHGSYGIDRDHLILPDTLVDDYATVGDHANTARILRPAFDTLYQSAGWQRCTSYDETGVWTPP